MAATTTYILDTSCLQDPSVYARCLQNLSSARQRKASSFYFEKDRLLSAAAGVVLDFGLKHYGLSEKEVCMAYNPFEKPYLPGRTGLHFNLSHSGTKAICSFSDCEVGADIEEISGRHTALTKSICTEEEAGYLSLLEKEEYTAAFFRIWTAKEAFLKCIGKGLSVSLRELNTTPFGTPLKILQNCCPGDFFFRNYDCPGYQITVCARHDSFADNLIAADLSEILH